MSFWEHEVDDFRRHLAESENNDYKSWQPAKWQSLTTIADVLLKTCVPTGGENASVLELGCGSATLLLQLQTAGLGCVGLDIDPQALLLAQISADSLGYSAPKLVEGSYDDPELIGQLQKADLVYHIGVIEHFKVPRQLEFLKLSADLSNRWVMVAVPNEHSPVFQSFLETVTREQWVFHEEHEDIDVQDLAKQVGLRPVVTDGAHVFFGSSKYYNPGYPELDALYAKLRTKLVAIDAERYADFPNVDFTREDIEVLRSVEENETTVQERLHHGFLTYHLFEKV